MVTRFMCVVGSLLMLSGCAPKPSVVPAASPAASVSRVGGVSPAVLKVQSLPLYREAEAACAQKDRARAVSLLKRLAADPALSADEKAFCQKQISLLTQPKAALTPAPSPKSGRREKFPVASSDCGPRALALLLGGKASVAEISQVAGTDATGTSMAGLKQAAQKFGMTATGLQVSREGLDDLHAPAIAWKNQNHYVAVLETKGSGEGWQAVVHDPNKPVAEMLGREEFLQMCGGYVLALKDER